eukprot:gene11949-biopygen8985
MRAAKPGAGWVGRRSRRGRGNPPRRWLHTTANALASLIRHPHDGVIGEAPHVHVQDFAPLVEVNADLHRLPDRGVLPVEVARRTADQRHGSGGEPAAQGNDNGDNLTLLQQRWRRRLHRDIRWRLQRVRNRRRHKEGFASGLQPPSE